MPLLANSDRLIVTENVQFRVGPHLLHGAMAYPEAGCTLGAVVLAGPHPLLGGNMRNNVVRCLGDGLAQRGLLTSRFDYRGVGRSQGPTVDVARHLAEFWRTSHALGEMDFWQDVQGAVEFVEQVAPGLPVTLVGYSFGCALLPYVRPRTLTALVLVAPTVAKHDYDSFHSATSPLLLVASEDDFATDAQRLEDWFDTLAMPRRLVRQRCDNHFFRGHEEAAHYTRPGAATFGGNLVSCRAALATLAYHQNHKLGERSTIFGDRLRGQLVELRRRRPEIAEVRGRGLMIGVELCGSEKNPAAAITDIVLERMKDASFLLGKTGSGRNVLTLMPPLVVTSDDLDTLVDGLEQVLRTVAE